MPMLRSLPLWTLVACLSLGSSGCITKILTDGNIAATRRCEVSFDTIDDYDLARAASEASFGQFEGLHELAPYNTDGLYLLLKAWSGYGAAFLQDDIEKAQDANDDAAEERARRRARKAYDRAIYYGIQQIGQIAETADEFDAAKKDGPTFAAWLARKFITKEDAAVLLWTGLAWLERVDTMKGEPEGPEFVADLWVGVAMIERAVAIDPTSDYYLGQLVLAGYHARGVMAEPELAKKMFDSALAQSQGKWLTIQFSYAVTYACLKSDAKLYRDLLTNVLTYDDGQLTARAPNAIAKHRARRWMGKKRAKESCGIDLDSTAAR